MGDTQDIVGYRPEHYVSGYLEYGGSAYGNSKYDPSVNHYFDGYEKTKCNGGKYRRGLDWI
jgi:hypothetical protein